MQSKHKQKNCKHRRRNSYTAFSVGITKLNQRIIWKDDIEFVTEFPFLLGHPVSYYWMGNDEGRVIFYFLLYYWSISK